MPFFWKSKLGASKRNIIPPETMKAAVIKVVEEKGSINKIAKEYGIDRKTLGRYVIKFKTNKDDKEIEMKANHAGSLIFSFEEETLIEKYLIMSSKLHYGLTPKTARQFVYQYGLVNNKTLPKNWHNDWLRGFMHRHQNLSLRRPESTSLGRATGFNQATVDEFFNNLRCVMEEHKFGPESIFNVDETGLTIVHKPSKIIAIEGKKQVAKVTSGERGTLVTMCATVNALGTSIPPFLVFPRQRVKDTMTRGTPPGTLATAHPSGWMTGENFELFLQHFIKYVKCSVENKVLVILDNHDSHIAPKGLQICKDNGIVLLTLPPHTSHILQPLDRTVFGPFKSYYNECSDDFMINHPAQPITIYDIPELIGKAFPRAFNPLNIQRGFSSTGIYPFNGSIFTELDFLGANVTDRPDPDAHVNSDHLSSDKGPLGLYEAGTSTCEISPEPSSSSNVGLFSQNVTPEQLRPYPKAGPRKGRGGRRPAKSRILTNTPIKTQIESEHALRKTKSNKVSKPQITKRQIKKKIFVESSESSQEEEDFWEKSSSDDLNFDDEDMLHTIDQGDFALVKFKTKSSFCYFVSRVVKKESNDDYYVTFMRRSEPGIGLYSFVYPEKEDTSNVLREDLIKLPPPVSSGGTERVGLKVNFDFDISRYQPVRYLTMQKFRILFLSFFYIKFKA